MTGDVLHPVRVSLVLYPSGEYAAAIEGFDIVPEQAMLYLRKEDLPRISEAAKESFAKVAPVSKANVIVRIADPWLNLQPDEPMVERGQRLLDYQESRHLQILKDLHGWTEWARLFANTKKGPRVTPADVRREVQEVRRRRRKTQN